MSESNLCCVCRNQINPDRDEEVVFVNKRAGLVAHANCQPVETEGSVESFLSYAYGRLRDKMTIPEGPRRTTWRGSTLYKTALNELFPALHKQLLSYVGKGIRPGTHPSVQLTVLKPSAAQLAAFAQSSDEFLKLVAALSQIGDPEQWESAEAWQDEIAVPSDEMSELMRRSGYYHAILAGQPPEDYWIKILNRLNNEGRETKIIHLLSGFDFPCEFVIGDHKISPVSAELLATIVPELVWRPANNFLIAVESESQFSGQKQSISRAK